MTRQAIVLGSNGPDWQSKLEFAEKDAVAIENVLSEHCECNVTLLPASIRSQDALQHIEVIAERATEEDSLIFYFSGHGEIVKGVLFLLLDGTTRRIFGSALNAAHVLGALRFSAASHKLAILDCCHAGGAGLRGEALLPFDVNDVSELVLCASDRLERARELKELNAGFLTYNICKVLNDTISTKITVDFLVQRLRCAALAHNSEAPDRQVPIPYLFGEARAPFILRFDRLSNLPPLIKVSNTICVDMLLIPEDYISSVSRILTDRNKVYRIISSVNKDLRNLDAMASRLDWEFLCITAKDDESFWYSIFDESRMSGHRTLSSLVRHITSSVDQSSPIFTTGIALIEEIHDDFARNAQQ